MLNSFVLGSYYAVDSKIHKCHPLTKIICCLLFIVSIVLFDSFFSILFSIIIVIVLVFLSKIPINLFVKSFLKSKYFLLGILIINIIFSSSFITGLFVVIKMLLIITISEVLLFTTSTNDMIEGLEMFLLPLKYVNISPTKIALSLVFSLHFIPILLSQTEKILKSQASRGLIFSELNFKEKIKSCKTMLLPMFVISLKKADIIADTLEVRHFNCNKKRSNVNFSKLEFHDIILIICCVIIFIFSLC